MSSDGTIPSRRPLHNFKLFIGSFCRRPVFLLMPLLLPVSEHRCSPHAVQGFECSPGEVGGWLTTHLTSCIDYELFEISRLGSAEQKYLIKRIVKIQVKGISFFGRRLSDDRMNCHRSHGSREKRLQQESNPCPSRRGGRCFITAPGHSFNFPCPPACECD